MNAPFNARVGTRDPFQAYVCDDATYSELKRDERVIFNYCDKAGNVTDSANPNGSRGNIAGICNAGRNVLGLMPHPERACEDLLGSCDGRGVFRSLAATLAAVTWVVGLFLV